MGTTRQIDVDYMSALPRYVEHQVSTNFHVIFTYFFHVISLIEKSTFFYVLFSMKFLWSKNPRCFHILFSM